MRNGLVTHDLFLALEALGRDLVSPGKDQHRHEAQGQHDDYEAEGPVGDAEAREQRAGHLSQQPGECQVGDSYSEYVTSFEFVIQRHASCFSGWT